METARLHFPASRRRVVRWKKKSKGFTLIELLAVLALGAILASLLGVYTYQALARKAPRQAEVERIVYDLHSQMIDGHLRAQLGSPVSVSLEGLALPVTGAPPSVTFLPPDGRLSGNSPVSFLVERDGICYSFHISRDGICRTKQQVQK